MASYTPNLNLYKPDSTDDFGDFRSEFNNNMDILDQGGGGSGDVVDVEVNGISVVDAGTKIAEITSYEEVTIAEYESIPVADRESNGIAYFIKDLNNKSVQGYPPLIYSDEEREVGVWRDGKPLYQKTIEFDTGVTASNIYFDISSYMPSDCVVVDNNIIISFSFGGDDEYFVNRYDLTGYLVENNTHYIKFGIGQAQYNKHVIFTIWYTKTTDVAGSGTWNGQGGLAHHYSTSEKVIGTWIDGKPLYEKTVSFTTNSSGNTTEYSYGISNIDKVIRYDGLIDRGDSVFISINTARWQGDSSDLVGSQINVGTEKINIFVNWNGLWNKNCYVTLQYTKTTD